MSIANAAHCSMMGGKQLPYKREVAWIGTDGTAYTALSHVHTDATHAKVEMSFSTISGFSYVADLKGKNFFGCTTNDGNAILTNYNDGYSWQFQLYSGNGVVMARGVTPGDHVITATRSANSLSLVFDGVVSSSSASANMTLGRMGVFTQNNYGPGNGVNPMPNRVPKRVAIHTFKYWDGDTLCADLVPIECLDGSGGFFDRINNEILVNLASSGAFVLPT